MEYVQSVLQLVDKLNTTVSTYYERGDITKDNKNQHVDLKQKYASAANILRRLETLSSPDFITLERLQLYGSTLQNDLRTLESWEQSIQGARRTHRVKRMQQILNACEANIDELFDFLSDKISPMLEAQSSNQDVYTPRNTTPRNPPRLILDYSTTATSEGQLRAAVTGKTDGRIVAVVASGKGGVGKTCALRGLAADAEIEKAFPGGRLYIELGNDATLPSIINGIATIVERTGGANLANAVRTERSLPVAANKAADWFSRHSCLFLVDDIWRVNGIDSSVLTILGSMANENSKLVYTTRDRHFLNGVDIVIEFLEKEPCGDLSRRMLKRHAEFSDDFKFDEKNRDAFEALLRICQGLPLAFGVVGGSVLTISRRKEETEKQDAWSDFHRDFCSKPKVLYAASAQQYGPLSKIVDASLQVVEKQHEREDFSKRFRSFCVLQKQQKVPDHVLQKLWGLESLEDAQRVIEIFEEVSLVQVKRGGDTFYVRLHDLILDLAVRKASDCLESESIFERLCRNYLPTDWTNDLRYEWWKVADDGYIHNNLCRLMRSAGKLEELFWLLSKPQWIVKRFVDGQVGSVEQDIRHGEEIAIDSTYGHSDRKEHLEAVRKAARRSCTFVASNPEEVWFQLHGRLLWHAMKCELTKRFVEEMEECAPRPWVKASLGLLQPPGALVEVIPTPGEVICISEAADEVWILWVQKGLGRMFKMGVTCNKSATGVLYTQSFECDGIDHVECGAFLREGISVVTAHRYGQVVIWNRETGQRKQVVKREHMVRRRAMCCGFVSADDESEDDEDRRRFIGFSLDGTRVATASSKHHVQIWETLSGKAVTPPLVGHSAKVMCVAWSPNGAHVVSGSRDKKLRLWDTRGGGKATATLAGHTDAVECVAWSADGRRIVSGSRDKTVRVWDTQSGKAVAQAPMRHADGVGCVGVSENGRHIVSGSLDNTVCVWDVQSGVGFRQPLVGHSAEVACVAVSANGRRVLSGSSDETVHVWDAQSEAVVTPPLGAPSRGGHSDVVWCVAASADGRRVVTGSYDRTVRVWDAHSGERVGRALRHGGSVTGLGVDAGCTRIVSFADDGIGRLWDVRSGVCVLTSRNAGWRAAVDALALTRSEQSEGLRLSRQVRDGARLLATCDEAVCNFEHGDAYFARGFDKGCRIVR